MDTSSAQGWYRDPYGVHQDRYFSAGAATKLVRDGRRESYDPPPSRPLPEGDLVSADQPGEASPDDSDLRRADDAVNEPPFDPLKARQAAFNVFERIGNW